MTIQIPTTLITMTTILPSNSNTVVMAILIRHQLVAQIFNLPKSKIKRRKRSKRVSLTTPLMRTMSPATMMIVINL